MKNLILALLSTMLLMATACQKEPVVKPTQGANVQTMDADPSGVEDPTKPPPHGNINKKGMPARAGHLSLLDADSVDSGVEDPTKPPPHGK